MRVVALKAFSTGTLTMEEKQVKEIPDELAAELIEQGIVAKSPEYYGGSGGGDFIVTFPSKENGAVSDVTKGELFNACESGKRIVIRWIQGSGQYAGVNDVIATKKSKTYRGTWSYDLYFTDTLVNVAGYVKETSYAIVAENSSSPVTLNITERDNVLAVIDENGTLDETFDSIFTAFRYKRVIIADAKTFSNVTKMFVVTKCWKTAGGNYVEIQDGANTKQYKATSNEGYPVLQT